MMYLYLMVYYLSGAIVWEPISNAGASWQSCVDLGKFAVAERKLQDIQVIKAVPYCVAGPVP
jgi:hypothetical protein